MQLNWEFLSHFLGDFLASVTNVMADQLAYIWDSGKTLMVPPTSGFVCLFVDKEQERKIDHVTKMYQNLTAY